jgi:glycyl-tRNA synthetase beta chain
MTQDLLIEIGTEELPPASLQELANAFSRGIGDELTELGITHGETVTFCTPRRLAVLISQVRDQQPVRTVSRRGPSIIAAYKSDGQPSKALEGFAYSCGVDVKNLQREKSEKGEWIVFQTVEPGQLTTLLIPYITERILMKLPIAKRMRWGSGDAEFVRPIHWVCIVFGGQSVPGTVLGVTVGRQTYGHRFHAPEAILVTHSSRYPQLLRDQGFVEPCFDIRRNLIINQLNILAGAHGVKVDIPDSLLNEVTALVEWPQALFGSFDPDFLSVPSEVLVETMQKNQKYFSIRDLNGHLQPNFIAISNIESKFPDQVIKGNERVLRPRFSDAKFFWQKDLKTHLNSYFKKLESIVFQEKLGSVADRCRRVASLAKYIAAAIGEDPNLAERAALLAKCDLATSMVFEFPNLQGIMGRYYAELSAEPPAVCSAIEEQYLPRFAGEALPVTGCGLVLALADRLDLLVGSFGISHRPTGAKDPYGLRRASIAVIRILVETPLDLNLINILNFAKSTYKSGILSDDTVKSVQTYILGRLEWYYQEQGISPDCVESVVAVGGTVLSQIDRRIRAVQSFRKIPSGISLAIANKRIKNIIAKNEITVDYMTPPDPKLFIDSAELRLWNRLQDLELSTEPLIRHQNYSLFLEQLAKLKDDLDYYFEKVMVMSEDKDVRENRLKVLKRLQTLFLHVADISLLQ